MQAILVDWRTWALLSALFAAMTAILGKQGVTGFDADVATLVRVLVICVFAAAVVGVSGKAMLLRSLTPQTGAFLVLSGLATGASWLCYFRALSLGPASRVAPVDKLSVVLVAIISVFALGETLSVRGWIGIALIAGGAALVSSAA